MWAFEKKEPQLPQKNHGYSMKMEDIIVIEGFEIVCLPVLKI
ncbi:hypothetical protein [Treponema sp. OMZ 305]|jgi:hypothetical protein|nr:hypothetical protein [Treponema sp. OMZ 305]